MQYAYNTHGVCAQRILIDVDDNVITHVEFIGGCSGNTQGVARLAEGRKIDEVMPLISGIRCGAKPTSCPDQLAQALKLIQDKEAQGEQA